MAFQVSGKTAIVTGAGSGINFSFAELLLSRNCNVVIADLTLRPEAKALIAKFSTGQPRAVFQETDVTVWAQLDRMFERATEEFGGADVVCPGAGVYEPPWSNFWHAPGQSPSTDAVNTNRYAQLDINLTHPIRTTQIALSHFYARGVPGSIVHISSIAGEIPFFPTPIYVASKHAVIGFVRSLKELEFPPSESGERSSKSIPTVRVTAVAPGVIRTPLWADHPEKLLMITKDDVWVTPEAVAKVMLELVEDPVNVGGTILEVGSRVRKIETFMDPGPSGDGNTVGNVEAKKKEIWSILAGLVG